MFSAISVVVAIAVVIVVLLMLFLIGASVDEDSHPLLEFVEEILERHGFACLTDLLFVFDPKFRGIVLESGVDDLSDYVGPVELFLISR